MSSAADAEQMSDAEPSTSARYVALVRSQLSRQKTVDGDIETEYRLTASLLGVPTVFRALIAARTEFFDAELLDALAARTTQVVCLGAGYDCRALRFRSAGVTFFEADLQATQDDKRRRLSDVGADTTDISFAPMNLESDDVRDVLSRAHHDPNEKSIFLCEGVLLYLQPQSVRRVLGDLRTLAPAGSRLVVTFALTTGGALRHSASADVPGEGRRSFFTRASALALLAECGWAPSRIIEHAADDSTAPVALLVVAAPV